MKKFLLFGIIAGVVLMGAFLARMSKIVDAGGQRIDACITEANRKGIPAWDDVEHSIAIEGCYK